MSDVLLCRNMVTVVPVSISNERTLLGKGIVPD